MWGKLALVASALALYALYAKGYTVKFKDGVVLALAPQMSRALPLIDQAHYNVGITRGAFVTSGTEGKHSAKSLHYVGLAVDLRTRDLTSAQINALARELRRLLGADYDVVIEATHIHVEYDPKR